MPELPEIEILRREAEEALEGKTVRGVRLSTKSKAPLRGADLIPRLEGGRVVGARRKGKVLLLDSEGKLTLGVHLMLIGQARLLPGAAGSPFEGTLALDFADGDRFEVRAVALRYLFISRSEDLSSLPPIAEMGLDAADAAFSEEYLSERVSRRNVPIKALLMDQKVVAGIGNTYANEILFAAHLHPERLGNSLSQEEIHALYEAIAPTLRRGLENGGSSVENWVHLDGSPGRMQDHFRINRRRGEPCLECGTPIERMEVGGRGSFFCLRCQPTEG